MQTPPTLREIREYLKSGYLLPDLEKEALEVANHIQLNTENEIMSVETRDEFYVDFVCKVPHGTRYISLDGHGECNIATHFSDDAYTAFSVERQYDAIETIQLADKIQETCFSQ